MSRPRGIVVTVVAVLVAMLPVETSAVARPQAPAAKHPSTTLLSSNSLRLTSTTGRHLYLSVEADRYSFRPRPSNPVETDLDIEVSDNAYELHDWAFSDVPDQTFRYDQHTGRGTLDVTSREMYSLGHMSLRITKRKVPSVHDCANGESFTRQPVTLTGVLMFRTRSSAWGRLGGGAPLTFKGRSSVETDYGNPEKICGAPLPRCSGAINWGGPGSRHGGFWGDSYRGRAGRQRGFLTFDTGEALKSTNDEVNRDDQVLIFGARPPTFTTMPDGAKQVTVHAGSHGDITGSATLVSTGTPSADHDSCRGGATTSWPASFTNGKNPLTVHMAIGGSFSSRNSTAGAYISRDPR